MDNEFLLAGYKFMSEIHLKQPRFTYSACGPFTKKRKDMKIYARRRYALYLSEQIR